MPTKTPRERIQEIMFATCPVDVQEPFFWKWNEHGLDMLEAFYVALLEEARQEAREEMITYISKHQGWEETEDNYREIFGFAPKYSSL